jgi:hypothetical protein
MFLVYPETLIATRGKITWRSVKNVQILAVFSLFFVFFTNYGILSVASACSSNLAVLHHHTIAQRYGGI